MSRARDDATTSLASYAAGLDIGDVPEDVAAQARTVLADTLGVLLQANTRAAVQSAIRTLPAGSGRCTVVGHGRGWDAPNAAFINGIGGHDIELDDFHSASRSHPAAVIVPAILAAAEVSAACSYGDMLAALIAGYDVQVRVIKATGVNAMFERGFHPTSVVGAVGAAVAAGRIFRLPIDEMRHAIGLAVSQSSGLMTVADDHSHMAKSFQTGVAARNGVTAASFARDGFRAAPDVFTGKHDSLRPFGGSATDPDRLLADLGSRYEIASTTLKRHACCALTHPAIDALLQADRHGIAVDDIRRIDVALATEAVPRIDANRLWTHNIQYLMALAAFERRIGLDHYTDRWTADPRIAALAARVTVRGDERLQAAFPERQGAVVTIESGAGEIVERCETPKGSPQRPLTDVEVADKFFRLTHGALDGASAAALWDWLKASDPGAGFRPLFDQLGEPAGTTA